MKMVLLDGGLANQMTQYIFARCLQEEQPEELVLLDDLWFYCQHDSLCEQIAEIEHLEYQLSKFPNIAGLPRASDYFDNDVWKEIVDIAQRRPRLRGGSHLPQIMKDNGLDFFMIAEATLYQFDGKVARMPYYHYMPEILQSQGNAYYFGWFTHGGGLCVMKTYSAGSLSFRRCSSHGICKWPARLRRVPRFLCISAGDPLRLCRAQLLMHIFSRQYRPSAKR